MGIHCFMFISFKLLFFFSEFSYAADSISSSQSICDTCGTSLISKDGTFELGFFSPGNSVNRYLGIWYKNIPVKTVVWVANRLNPINDSTGMKLGWDLRTGFERRLTSWKSPNDPSPGNFTWEVEPQQNPEVVIWEGSTKFYRGGPWNGRGFSGAPELKPNPLFTFSFVSNKNEIYYTYKVINNSVISRIVLNQTEHKRDRFTWSHSTQNWKLYATVPRDRCDSYGLCGSYGVCIISESPICQCLKGFRPKSPVNVDWSQGCVRNKPLNLSAKDGFIKFEGLKLPDANHSLVNENMNLKECSAKCLQNSSCMAYANTYVNGTGSGCTLWLGDLIDMRQIADSAQDLFIRMSASEIGLSEGKKKISGGFRYP